MPDYDSPWKEALDEYFEAFVALFFPVMHGEIDWERGYETLDKELQQVTPDAESGRRIVDKLVRVWRRDGNEEWVLVHVEVQGQEESQFAWRMFVYNCRLVERYNRPVVSLAVLVDENVNWRPKYFHRELWGCATEFRFPAIKLLDYAARIDELECSDNLFASVVLAHLKALETRRDIETRYNWKVRLVRGLFERGLSANHVRKLFRLIDWFMALPKSLAEQFRDELSKIQEEKHMPYVTSVELLAEEKGWKRGREEGLEAGLEAGRGEGREEGREHGLKEGIRLIVEQRFGKAGDEFIDEVNTIHDTSRLRSILQEASRSATFEQLRAWWEKS